VNIVASFERQLVDRFASITYDRLVSSRPERPRAESKLADRLVSTSGHKNVSTASLRKKTSVILARSHTCERAQTKLISRRAGDRNFSGRLPGFEIRRVDAQTIDPGGAAEGEVPEGWVRGFCAPREDCRNEFSALRRSGRRPDRPRGAEISPAWSAPMRSAPSAIAHPNVVRSRASHLSPFLHRSLSEAFVEAFHEFLCGVRVSPGQAQEAKEAASADSFGRAPHLLRAGSELPPPAKPATFCLRAIRCARSGGTTTSFRARRNPTALPHRGCGFDARH